jgi:hypothetical protein
MGIAIVSAQLPGLAWLRLLPRRGEGIRFSQEMRNLERGQELRDVVAKESLPVTLVQLDVDNDTSVDTVLLVVWCAAHAGNGQPARRRVFLWNVART